METKDTKISTEWFSMEYDSDNKDDESISYFNPIIPGFYPDPSICRVDSDYYLVNSTFEYFPGVPVFHSRDLVNWIQIGHCLTRPSQLNLKNAACSSGIWAPTIRYNKGNFYMITTNMVTGENFYVTTTDPSGEWSEPVYIDKGAFDPSLFFDDDGKVYYTRRDWNLNGTGQAEIDIDTGKILSSFRRIAGGFCSKDQEGPHLYKINGYYYLMTAEGGTRYGHMETIGKSSSPWGPFEPCPHNPILTHRHISSSPVRHTGHGDMIQAHDGSWWIVFLGTRHHTYEDCNILGRETFLAPVTWTQDGWPLVNGSGKVELNMRTSTLPLHKWDEKYPSSDDFDESSLRLYWNFLRNPYDKDWSLTIRKGYLRLMGSAVTLSDSDSPAFVGRRQQHFDLTARALLQFEPINEGEEAGICIITRNTFHYEIAVIKHEGIKCVIVRRTVEDLSAVVYQQEIGPGNIVFQINGNKDNYEFLYSLDGSSITFAAKGSVRFLSNEIAAVFTGNYIGMYATGNGNLSKSPADFDWFEYNAL